MWDRTISSGGLSHNAQASFRMVAGGRKQVGLGEKAHRVPLGNASCVVRIDGHALETVFHEVVVVALGTEALDCVGGLMAGFALVPGVQGEQSHGAVRDHERGAYGGDAVAPIPGNHVDELEHARQKQLDP